MHMDSIERNHVKLRDELYKSPGDYLLSVPGLLEYIKVRKMKTNKIY